MPTPPSGEIIARPMVVRACGCSCEFQHYQVDKFRAQRLAKFKATRCPACAAKRIEEQQNQVALPPKAEALKVLPAGTEISLTRRADGTWAGKLTAQGVTVESVGVVGAGAPAVVSALARLWVKQTEES